MIFEELFVCFYVIDLLCKRKKDNLTELSTIDLGLCVSITY